MENQVLAKVGPLTVTLDEVEEFIAGLGQRGQAYNTPEGRKIILEQLIGNKLLLLDAKRNLLETEPEFKAQLARVKEELLISYATNKAIESVRVTEKEARDYYDSNPEQFIGEETVNASHILVATEEEAVEMISSLSGATHKVVTGVTLRTAKQTISFSAESLVSFRTLEAEEVRYYVEKYRPLDKAGAYGIQEWIGYIGIEGIEGSFYNVMGLPVQRLYATLKELI